MDDVNGYFCECSPGYEGTLCDQGETQNPIKYYLNIRSVI